jgi:hypothetical protein
MGEGDIGAPGIDNVEVTGDNASAITSPAARKSVRRSVTTEAPKTRYVSAPSSAALRRPAGFERPTRPA